MSKNKIPLWDNLKDYPAELDELINDLIAISDQDYQMRVWYNMVGPEMDNSHERAMHFEDSIYYFKKKIRSKEVTLSKEQIKAVLRTYIMHERFSGMLWDKSVPSKFPDNERWQIEHPYWQKVCKQAAHALSLLKTNPPTS